MESEVPSCFLHELQTRAQTSRTTSTSVGVSDGADNNPTMPNCSGSRSARRGLDSHRVAGRI
jgi:hypothetical protein